MASTAQVIKQASGPVSPATAPSPKPLAASFITGLVASLCCGGSLIFASVGLGAFYSGLGLFRFIPQALTAGALSIVAINYLSYRHAAKRAAGRSTELHKKMFVSTTIGLMVMAGAFILLEWLNHAVVHGDRFLARPEFSQAFIQGVPNVELLYVGAVFFALALLWALPFPRGDRANTSPDGWVKRTVRVAVLGATAVLIAAVVLDATPLTSTTSGPHGRAH